MNSKKQYIFPVTEVHHVTLRLMSALSGTNTTNATPEDISGGSLEMATVQGTGSDESAFGAKEVNMWEE